MEENKRTELDKINEKKEIMTPKDYRSIFWRSFTIQGSWSFDKMMAYGYMYAIEKPLRKIYPNDDDFYAALKRHTETFNVTPHVSPFLMTLGVAMEEENAKKLAEKIAQISLNISAKAGENGKLFGSVTSKELSEILKKEHGFDIDKRKFVLPDGIKSEGTYTVDIKLHPGIVAKLKVTVKAQ